jgi:hypothetical protein
MWLSRLVKTVLAFEKMTAGGWTVLRFQKLSPEKFEKVSILEFELSKFTGI